MNNKVAFQRLIKGALMMAIILFGFNVFFSPSNFGNNLYADNSATEAALKYYEEKYGAEKGMEGIRATKVRLGCHEEIRIYRGNEILMRADYVYGRIYE